MATRVKRQYPVMDEKSKSPGHVLISVLLLLAMTIAMVPFQMKAAFAQIEPADTTNGYIARLLINEAAFPSERGWVSESDSKGAMLQILWVLHSRIHLIPAGYRQKQIAGVHSEDIIDIITGTGGRRQCAGFYRDRNGDFVIEPRVEERLNYLLEIANSGGRPGEFAGLLNYAQGLASAYVSGGIEEADRYAGIKQIGSIEVTGHAYSWMTDIDNYHPGGNFVTIPPADDGTLGGNRFFTLRRYPR
jgi:hypothetical protein